MAPGRIRPSSKLYRSTMDWCEQTQNLTIISSQEGGSYNVLLNIPCCSSSSAESSGAIIIFAKHTVNRKGCGNHFPGFVISNAWKLHSLIAKGDTSVYSNIFIPCAFSCAFKVCTIKEVLNTSRLQFQAERAYKTIFHHVS